jgi:hypothetical protein
MERWSINKIYSEYIEEVMDILVRMIMYKDVETHLYGSNLNGPFLLDRVEDGLFRTNAMAAPVDDKLKNNKKIKFVMYVEYGNVDG